MTVWQGWQASSEILTILFVFTVEMPRMNLLGRKIVILALSTECSVSSHTFGIFLYCTFEMLHYSFN